MANEVMVSICCITYNHENFIADAIESFLMQKTDFDYEIVIHDDASTDKTAEIIRKYENKYPNKIRPIYQTENQYSKGVNVGRLNGERANGKYIANCEGDDYWTDPFKLQKQVDYMEKSPECSLCVHAVYRVKPDRSYFKPHMRPNRGDKVYTVEEVILGGGGLFGTNSMLYPAVFFGNRPDFYNNAPIGDYPSAIYLALQGTVYYIDEFMSAYRVGVPGSWTNKISSESVEKRVRFHSELIDMLDEINRYTKYKYDHAIIKTKKYHQFYSLIFQGRFTEAKEVEFEEIYSALYTSTKIRLFLEQYFPGIAKILIKVKRNFLR
ncbi:MAG: glycosyltransferase family 2 protein [Desulfosporosinus sp.]